jgi:acetylglutamate kinase
LKERAMTPEEQKTAEREARIVARALPYLRRYAGATIVVKYGGHAMGADDLASGFGSDIALLKQVGINPVVVHGGGRSVNKHVAGLINRAGALAVGISGKDGGLIRARKLERTVKDPDSEIERVLDLGFVGEPGFIDTRVIHALTGAGLIPVVAPVGTGEDGQTYNINADTAAGAIAGALNAQRLLMLTDVQGVLDKEKRLMPDLSLAQIRALIADGTISGGMIPKVETCMEAVTQGVKGATILDGRVPHALLLELFTEGGIGTMIHK